MALSLAEEQAARPTSEANDLAPAHWNSLEPPLFALVKRKEVREDEFGGGGVRVRDAGVEVDVL